MDRLLQMLTALRHPNGCPVTVHYLSGKAEATLDLGADWKIRVQDAGLEPLKALLGENNVKVQYARPVAAPEAAQTGDRPRGLSPFRAQQ